MNPNTPDGGPAFPVTPTNCEGTPCGMSLLDYFAAHATKDDVEAFVDYTDAEKHNTWFPSFADSLAYESAVERAWVEAKFRYAAAMLAARNGGAK